MIVWFLHVVRQIVFGHLAWGSVFIIAGRAQSAYRDFVQVQLATDNSRGCTQLARARNISCLVVADSSPVWEQVVRTMRICTSLFQDGCFAWPEIWLCRRAQWPRPKLVSRRDVTVRVCHGRKGRKEGGSVSPALALAHHLSPLTFFRTPQQLSTDSG